MVWEEEGREGEMRNEERREEERRRGRQTNRGYLAFNF